MEEFVCRKCGECCKNHGIVIIYPEDAVNIAEYLNMSIKQFLKLYCYKRILKNNINDFEIYYMEIGGKCCFLNNNNLCSINDVKPLQCKYGPTRYFLSVESQENCIFLRDKKEVLDQGMEDSFFVQKLLQGYDD